MLSDNRSDAREAGLRYVDDTQPGIRRKRIRSHFRYYAADGAEIVDAGELERIRKLAIPPAYEDVWICAIPSGHLQATARDARGRKQYRYHPAWREARDANKYAQTVQFARAVGDVRARVEGDLVSDDPRTRLLAAVVRLLENTHIRVGNDEYARTNESFGLTTLRAKHAKVSGSTVRFEFRGKSGVAHAISLVDKRLSKIIKRARELPGEELFTYIDGEGEPVRIRSDDVNAYVREIAGDNFSAKDFRTLYGTVTCALELERIGPAGSAADAKRKLKEALETTARELGNTAAVARKCYVHPAIVETYLDELHLTLPKAKRRTKTTAGSLDPNEERVIAFLERNANRGRRSLPDGLRRSLVRSTAAGRNVP